jgi:CDP-glycerol glycerophosphotransferase
VAASGSRRVTKWEVRVEAALQGTAGSSGAGRLGTETSLETRRDHGSAVIPRSVLVADALVSTRWSDRRGLVVEVQREFAAVTGVVADDDAFEVAVLAPGLPAVSQVHVGTTTVPATIVPATRPDCWTIRLTGREPGAEPVSGRVRVAAHTPDRQTLPVVGDLEPASVRQGGVGLTISNDGQLTAIPDQPVLLVDHVEVGTETVRVAGRAHQVVDGQVVLRGPRAESDPRPLEVVDGTFSLEVPMRHSAWGQAPTPLPANVYTLAAESHGRPVRVLAGRLFHDTDSPPAAHGWAVETVPDRRLMLRRTRHADRTTASRLGQQRLRSGLYAEAASRPRRDLVVLESFEGAGTGDGPRAVCEGLLESRTDLDLAWSVDDLSVAPLDGTRVVLRGTPEWYDAMGSARLVVTNTTLPQFYVKGPDQVHVQTWHGTPLKRIGTDIPHQRLSTEHHLRLLLGQAHSWDYLVSSSPFTTEVFRRAFAYDGEILEIGRPCNDLLVGPGSSAVREEVRARLAVPEGQTVLLYAPTWRDDAWRGGTWDKVLHLDCEAVTRARPDVTVLVRGHPNTAHRPRVDQPARVVDVTGFPDFTRLLLAADVLVTDYSGAMFDFAHTDRPMIFLTPDLETYRDRVRGLYLDLEELAPGPVVRTTEDVLGCLDLEDRWSAARHHLRSTYAPLDDGAVTKRLLAVLGEHL